MQGPLFPGLPLVGPSLSPDGDVARGFLLRLLLCTPNLPLLPTLGLKRRDLLSLPGCTISLATLVVHLRDPCVLYTRWCGLLLICLHGCGRHFQDSVVQPL